MQSYPDKDEMLRIIEELERRICCNDPNLRRSTTLHLIDEAKNAIESICLNCSDPEINTVLRRKLSWDFIEMKHDYGWLKELASTKPNKTLERMDSGDQIFLPLNA